MKHRKNKIIILLLFIIIVLIGGIFLINKNNISDSDKKIIKKDITKKQESTENKVNNTENEYSSTNVNSSEPAKNEEQENKQEFNSNLNATISLIGDEEISLNMGEKYTEYGAKAVDENNNDVSKYITIDNTVDTSKKGEYVVIYSIGKSTVIRNVIIK